MACALKQTVLALDCSQYTSDSYTGSIKDKNAAMAACTLDPATCECAK